MTEQRRQVGIGDPPVNRTAGLNDGSWMREPRRRKRSKDPGVVLQFRVDPALKLEWEAEARRRGETISHVLRHWIEYGRKAEESEHSAAEMTGVDRAQQQMERLTTLDMALEVARRLRDGE